MFPDPDDAVSEGRLSAGALPGYLLPDTAGVDREGRLAIAGVDILELCSDIGTPVFIYDGQVVFLSEGHARVVTRRETLDDLTILDA